MWLVRINAHGEMHSIQQYVTQFVSDSAEGRFISPSTPVSSTNKTDRHDITEILLKVALNTIYQTKPNQTKQFLVNNVVLTLEYVKPALYLFLSHRAMDMIWINLK